MHKRERERGRDSVCVCVCVCVREREREVQGDVCVRDIVREKKRVFVFMFV